MDELRLKKLYTKFEKNSSGLGVYGVTERDVMELIEAILDTSREEREQKRFKKNLKRLKIVADEGGE